MEYYKTARSADLVNEKRPEIPGSIVNDKK